MSALTKKGKFWWLDIRIGGKRIRRSLKTTEKHLALYRYKEKKDELEAEHSGKKVQFADFCKKYLDWAWSSKPASTLREKQRLEKIRDFFKGLDIIYLEDITPYHVEQLKAHLKKKELSRATINRYLQILRGMFYKAIDWEIYTGANPLKKIKFYRENSSKKALSDNQVTKIMYEALQISKSPKSELQKVIYDIMSLAVNTGMRKSEILNLKWKDIGKDEIEVIGKGGRIRFVPLNFRANALIIRQLKKSVYVFDVPNRNQPDLLRRTISQIKKRTGIEFSFHDLRHFFATKLIEVGADIITISEILGHSKITTSLIYSHTDKQRKKKAVDYLTK